MHIYKSILFHLGICLFLTGLLLPSTSQAYVESFENGIPGSWMTSGDGAWTTTSSTAQAGISSLQSPTITHEQSATLQTIRPCAAGNITFYYATSTEENNDQLQFYIDGELIDSFSGENAWTQVSYPVTVGLHTFTWTYSKDLNFFEGDDTAWLDHVRFPGQRLAAGAFHSLYINTDSTLWAWGKNQAGQVGNGTSSDCTSPVQIGTDNDWSQVSAGWYHSMALKQDGTLWAWGYNYNGQLGDGTTSRSYVPIQIGTENNWCQVAAVYTHTLALKTNGTLWAWGANDTGELGDGTHTERHVPTLIGSDDNWAQLAGYLHSLALKIDGTLWAWGENNYGQLGDGGTTDRLIPTQIGSNTNWSQAIAGYRHSLATQTNGTLWAWGYNGSGQLGDGTTIDKSSPVQVQSETGWNQVSAGINHSLAMESTDSLWAWGSNSYGQVGNWPEDNSPMQVDDTSSWVYTIAGGNFSMGIKTDGTLWAWGQNSDGQLGDGTTIHRDVPTPILALIDTDSDGIFDNNDAFLTDPAASVDTDGDGYPDSWNDGYTQADSTTGLTLDDFPNDPDEHLATPLNDTTTFVQQVYQDFLGRDADAGGLAYWVDAINNQGVPRGLLVEGFINSVEFGQTVAPVTRLYFAYFNRIPDYSGLMYWIGRYSDGTPLATISDAFAGSAEFIATYGSLDNSAFVTLVYQNVLGREPDAGGLAHWTGVLDRSEQTRGQVLIGFSESAEYQELMTNKIYVTMTYIGLLRRSPDQGGFNYWVGVMDSGGSGLGLIEGFLTSGEYAARF